MPELHAGAPRAGRRADGAQGPARRARRSAARPAATRRTSPACSIAKARCGRQLGDPARAIAAYRASGGAGAEGRAGPLAPRRAAPRRSGSPSGRWRCSARHGARPDGRPTTGTRSAWCWAAAARTTRRRAAFREAATRDAEERALRLQPRPGADAGRPARGRRVVPHARWRSTRRSGRRASASRNCADDARGARCVLARSSLARAVDAAATFWPVRGHAFLNWDDPDVARRQSAPAPAGAALVAWAFTTRDMGHYQPLSWLALAPAPGGRRSPARVHTAGPRAARAERRAAARRLTRWRSRDRGRRRRRPLVRSPRRRRRSSRCIRCASSPWRGPARCPTCCRTRRCWRSVGCWIAWTRGGRTRAGWGRRRLLRRVAARPRDRAAAAARAGVRGHRGRPHAPGRAARGTGSGRWRRSRSSPCRWRCSRPAPATVESLADVGLGPRLAVGADASGPVPVANARAAGPDAARRAAAQRVADWARPVVVAVAGVGRGDRLTVAAVVGARAALAVWGSYLLLLLPVVGLLPVGRAGHGRSLHLRPGDGAGGGAGRRGGARRRRPHAAPRCSPPAPRWSLLVPATRDAQAAYWHDSVALWSRAVALDADNDVALYNLALAAGRRRPDRRRRRAPAAAGRAGARPRAWRGPGSPPWSPIAKRRPAIAPPTAGRFADAVAAYDRALDADPARTRRAR